MKLFLTILGGLAVLVGCVWMGQGLNLLPGNLMRGQTQWIINGALMALAGAGLIWWGRRRAAP